MAETFTFILLLLATVMLYLLVAKKLTDTIFTPPMLFLVVGLLVSPLVLNALDFNDNQALILLYAEIALAITLFTDSASVDFGKVRKNRLPARLLLIGLPLTIALGTVVALVSFAGLSIGEAGLIGAILAPTDASLGQAIIQNKHVPERVREALDVESGLNDGGSVPFFALFLVMAQAEAGQVSIASWADFAIEQIGFGVVVGLVVGFVGARLLRASIKKEFMPSRLRPIALISLALIAFFVADAVGGSGFIGAYVAGLMIAASRLKLTEELVEFAGAEGEVLDLGVFFILGIMFVTVLPGITWMVILYAILSLTLVRMLPVWTSLVRSKLRERDKLFIGWFGPRGLASIVLVMIALQQSESIHGIGTVVTVVLVTVLISVFAHGVTAAPFARRYGAQD